MPVPDTVERQDISYSSKTGQVEAYLAVPGGAGPHPAVLVVQEVFGLVQHIREVADRFAAEGYLALVPDLYCHDKQRLEVSQDDVDRAMAIRRDPDRDAAIAKLPEEQQVNVRRAGDWLANRDTSTYLGDLQDGLAYLRGRDDVRSEAIACVGYCMGGGLAGRMATSGADLAATVIYYGGIPPVEEVPQVRCPVQGHYGGEDPNITSHVPELQAAMDADGKPFTAYVYDGAPHAFGNDHIPNYHASSAQLAWERTLEFLAAHLK
jgi:carboxymethylenebutenolidase